MRNVYAALAISLLTLCAGAAETETCYLSGHGKDDAVPPLLLAGIGAYAERGDQPGGRGTDEGDDYAARMSHYPPDTHFLDACDEMGLYVLDELSGWQHAHDTEVGAKLVAAMVKRDVNHPCILLWDNGNEGGWNTSLDGEFAKWDPQQRHVMHPWGLSQGMNTAHYKSYESVKKSCAGADLYMPTEFLHALHDGGGGAGLDDYWEVMRNSPVGVGGFIWALLDEGVVRTDQVRGDTLPTLAVENRYDFTTLSQCRFLSQKRRLSSK